MLLYKTNKFPLLSFTIFMLNVTNYNYQFSVFHMNNLTIHFDNPSCFSNKDKSHLTYYLQVPEHFFTWTIYLSRFKGTKTLPQLTYQGLKPWEQCCHLLCTLWDTLQVIAWCSKLLLSWRIKFVRTTCKNWVLYVMLINIWSKIQLCTIPFPFPIKNALTCSAVFNRILIKVQVKDSNFKARFRHFLKFVHLDHQYGWQRSNVRDIDEFAQI